MLWRNNKCGFGMNHISCVVFHMATCLLWFSTEISMANLPVRLLDHNFVNQTLQKKREKKQKKHDHTEWLSTIGSHLTPPVFQVETTRAFATLAFFVFGPAAVVAGRLVGAWRKFVWRVTWLICLMRQFKCPISNKMPLQIRLSKPYFKKKKRWPQPFR